MNKRVQVGGDVINMHTTEENGKFHVHWRVQYKDLIFGFNGNCMWFDTEESAWEHGIRQLKTKSVIENWYQKEIWKRFFGVENRVNFIVWLILLKR